MKKHFNRLSDWIPITRLTNDVECPDYMKDVFEFNGSTYHIYDFTKIHYNPWFGDDSDFPEFITGIQRNPEQNGESLFIEISDNGEQVRVYLEAKDGGNDV